MGGLLALVCWPSRAPAGELEPGQVARLAPQPLAKQEEQGIVDDLNGILGISSAQAETVEKESEIAQMLSVPAATVKSRVRYGLLKLAERLQAFA